MFWFFICLCYRHAALGDLPVLTPSFPPRSSSGLGRIVDRRDGDRPAQPLREPGQPGWIVDREEGRNTCLAALQPGLEGNLATDAGGLSHRQRQRWREDRKSTRLNSSNYCATRMPYSARTKNKHQ